MGNITKSKSEDMNSNLYYYIASAQVTIILIGIVIFFIRDYFDIDIISLIGLIIFSSIISSILITKVTADKFIIKVIVYGVIGGMIYYVFLTHNSVLHYSTFESLVLMVISIVASLLLIVIHALLSAWLCLLLYK